MNLNLLKEQTEEFIEHGRKLWESTPTDSTRVVEFIDQFNVWVRACLMFYDAQFSETSLNSLRGRLTLFTVRDDHNSTNPYKLERIKTDLKEAIKGNVDGVRYIYHMAKSSDILYNSQLITSENRVDFSIKQKRDFILKKLVEFKLEKTVDVRLIFKMNGVVATDNEIAENIDLLVKKKLVRRINDQARLRTHIIITTLGREYVEESNKEKVVKGTGKKDIEKLNKKIDEIIELLHRNNDGNEILYEELQEMKAASSKLDLKNWHQLLKGKLISLVSDKASDVTKELAADIYETLAKSLDLPRNFLK